MYYKVLSQEDTVIGVVDNSNNEDYKLYDGLSWETFTSTGEVAESVGGNVTQIGMVEFDCLVAGLATQGRQLNETLTEAA